MQCIERYLRLSRLLDRDGPLRIDWAETGNLNSEKK
jgi:hypothetical protein